MKKIKAEIISLEKKIAGSPEADASEMVGDGKTPNKYFLSTSNDFDVVHNGDDHGADEVIKGFKSKGGTTKVFDTYHEAKEAADRYSLGHQNINRVTIEDRITGVVYERVKRFNVDKCSVTEDEHEDIGYTKEKLGKDFK